MSSTFISQPFYAFDQYTKYKKPTIPYSFPIQYKLIRKIQNLKVMTQRKLSLLIQIIRNNTIAILPSLSNLFKQLAEQIKLSDTINAQKRNNTPILTGDFQLFSGSKYFNKGMSFDNKIFFELYEVLKFKINKEYLRKIKECILEENILDYNQREQQDYNILWLAFKQAYNLFYTLQNTSFLSKRFEQLRKGNEQLNKQTLNQKQKRMLLLMKEAKKNNSKKQIKQMLDKSSFDNLFKNYQLGKVLQTDHQFYDFKEAIEKIECYLRMAYDPDYLKDITKQSLIILKPKKLLTVPQANLQKIRLRDPFYRKLHRQRSSTIPFITMSSKTIKKQANDKQTFQQEKLFKNLFLSFINNRNLTNGSIIFDLQQSFFNLTISLQHLFHMQSTKQQQTSLKDLLKLKQDIKQKLYKKQIQISKISKQKNQQKLNQLKKQLQNLNKQEKQCENNIIQFMLKIIIKKQDQKQLESKLNKLGEIVMGMIQQESKNYIGLDISKIKRFIPKFTQKNKQQLDTQQKLKYFLQQQQQEFIKITKDADIFYKLDHLKLQFIVTNNLSNLNQKIKTQNDQPKVYFKYLPRITFKNINQSKIYQKINNPLTTVTSSQKIPQISSKKQQTLNLTQIIKQQYKKIQEQSKLTQSKLASNKYFFYPKFFNHFFSYVQIQQRNFDDKNKNYISTVYNKQNTKIRQEQQKLTQNQKKILVQHLQGRLYHPAAKIVNQISRK